MKENKLLDFLESNAKKYNCIDYITNDPIQIPHRFSTLQDIEIMGFWVSMFAWGKRKMIINSGNRLVELMDGQPYHFILNHKEKDCKRFLEFKHRTFQPTDALYFLTFLQQYYQKNDSLENAFSQHINEKDKTIKNALIGFHDLFFDLPYAPKRTRKHVATPIRGSACKRLNMFLRWMVRKDNNGVDFGLWSSISPSQLVIPLDVHVDRVARELGLLKRKQTDWKAAIELTNKLRTFDPTDPAKYDFALFGYGLMQSQTTPDKR